MARIGDTFAPNIRISPPPPGCRRALGWWVRRRRPRVLLAHPPRLPPRARRSRTLRASPPRARPGRTRPSALRGPRLQRAEEGLALLYAARRLRQVAVQVGRQRQVVEREAGPPRAQLLEDGQTLRAIRAHPLRLALIARDVAQTQQRAPHAFPIPQLPMQRQAFLVEGDRPRIPALLAQHQRQLGQGGPQAAHHDALAIPPGALL